MPYKAIQRARFWYPHDQHPETAVTEGLPTQEPHHERKRLLRGTDDGHQRRGIKHANWELEFLAKEKGARIFKVYQPEDDGPINDRRLWPFYEKVQELGVVLTLHTGVSPVPMTPAAPGDAPRP